MRKLNISDWYDLHPDARLAEEVEWALRRPFRRFLEFVLPRIDKYGIKSVLEFDCRSGRIAAAMSHVAYIGFERNAWFAQLAQRRNPATIIKLTHDQDPDIEAPLADLTINAGFIKHYNLDVWDQSVVEIIKRGRWCALAMQIANRDLDDGGEYYHVFVTEEHLRRVIKEAGHRVIDWEVVSTWTLSEGPAFNVFIWSARQ